MNYSYTPGCTLAMCYLLPEKHALVDKFYYIFHKNSMGHLLWISRDYFYPPPKVLEKMWTICLLYRYVHQYANGYEGLRCFINFRGFMNFKFMTQYKIVRL